MEINSNLIELFWILDCGSSDSDMDDIDIENMLDEGLPDVLRDHKKQQHYEEKYKTIIDGINWINGLDFSLRQQTHPVIVLIH